MARARGTDGSLLPSLPWTLGALIVALLPHIPYLPFWITGAFLGCAAWRYAIEMRRRPLPGCAAKSPHGVAMRTASLSLAIRRAPIALRFSRSIVAI